MVAGPFTGELRYPVVDASETELFFVEFGAGNVPLVYAASRATPADVFTNPVRQDQLTLANTSNLTVTGLSADGCELYLAARRGDTFFEVYRARRAPAL